MEILLLIISISIIVLVLLQSSKAESAQAALTGGNDNLFKNRKERGGELFITRLTATLGFLFIAICAVLNYM